MVGAIAGHDDFDAGGGWVAWSSSQLLCASRFVFVLLSVIYVVSCEKCLAVSQAASSRTLV